jgi:hypothetical protein
MQPAPPAALQLALRLKQLRQGWPEARLTQEKLATAFSGEEAVRSVTVSSWENNRSPKTPPPHRLEAYARFFATRRSVDGDPKLLLLEELTPDESRVYRELEAELFELRRAATGESIEEEPTFNRSWLFQDGAPVTLVCAELPADQIGPLGNPADPNFTELQTYADIDSLVELFGHIRAENPTATVHFKTPDRVSSDELTGGHLVLLGGVVWNEVTETLSKMAKLPVRQVENDKLKTGEIFVAEANGKQRQFWPQWKNEGKTELTEDVGLLARVPNPLNASRTLTICNGIHSRGVYGAVRTLTDAQLRDNNERYISANFGGTDSFAMLMAVKMIQNKPMTPDFNSPGVVLYQWAQDVL